MGFQDLGHFLLQGGWKLTICLCCDDLVTCAAPGFGVGVKSNAVEMQRIAASLFIGEVVFCWGRFNWPVSNQFMLGFVALG